eukprot:1195409-Prorocentrum_minimum.AAC.7
MVWGRWDGMGEVGRYGSNAPSRWLLLLDAMGGTAKVRGGMVWERWDRMGEVGWYGGGGMVWEERQK